MSASPSCLLVAFALAIPRLATTGTDSAPSTPLAAAQDDEAKLPKKIEKEIPKIQAAAKAELSDPALFDRALESVSDGRLARLLEALHIQFKTFERDSDGDPALGFDYAIAKSLAASTAGGDGGWSLDFVANGNVAFDQAINPDDFLSTSLRVRWFGSTAFGEPGSREVRAGEPPVPRDELVKAFVPKFRKAADELAELETGAEVRAHQLFQELKRDYIRDVKSTLPTELFYDFDLHASLESNQDFSSRQGTFGASVGGRLVSWNPDAGLSRLNVFDFPGAALRWLSGQSEDFTPSGEAWPTIVTGLDLVDASEDEIRQSLTDEDTFLRARVEAGLKTRVLNLEDEALFLSAGWRFYQEIDAPAAVRRAETDDASHFQVKLDLPKGWALTYAAGRLPLDGQDDSTFALGFNVQF